MNDNILNTTEARNQRIKAFFGERFLANLVGKIVRVFKPLFEEQFASVWLIAVAVPALIHSWSSIERLFKLLGYPEPWMAGFSTVGVTLALSIVYMVSKDYAVRASSQIFIGIWVLLMVALVSFEGVYSNTKGIITLEGISGIGRAFAGILAGIVAIPAVVVGFASRGTKHFDTQASATAFYAGAIVKLVLLGASTTANISFGLEKKMPIVVAVLCGFVFEGMFIWSYFKREDAARRGDIFDKNLWSFLMLVYGVMLSFMSFESISVLSNIQIWWLEFMREGGLALYTLALGIGFLSFVLATLAADAIDWIPAKSQNKATPSVVGAKYVPTLGAMKQAPVFNATGHRQPILVEDEDDPK